MKTCELDVEEFTLVLSTIVLPFDALSAPLTLCKVLSLSLVLLVNFSPVPLLDLSTTGFNVLCRLVEPGDELPPGFVPPFCSPFTALEPRLPFAWMSPTSIPEST